MKLKVRRPDESRSKVAPKSLQSRNLPAGQGRENA